MAAVLEDDVAEGIEQLREGCRPKGSGLVDHTAEVGGGGGVQDGTLGERFVLGGHHVQGGAAHFADLVRRNCQVVGHGKRDVHRLAGNPYTRFALAKSCTW